MNAETIESVEPVTYVGLIGCGVVHVEFEIIEEIEGAE
jgi:hypothetical protein